MEHTLATLRDVEGVSGAFLLDTSGRLLATAVPGFVGHEELRNAGPRIAGILDAFGEVSSRAELAHLAFDRHHLYVTPCGDGWLVALGHDGLNLRSLKLGLRLVVRRLTRTLEESRATAPRVMLASMSLPPKKPQPSLPGYASSADMTPIPGGVRTPRSPVSAQTVYEDTVRTEPSVRAFVDSARPPPPSQEPVSAPAARSRTIVYRGRKYTVDG